MLEKFCKKCNTLKTLDQFDIDSRTKLGVAYQCKACRVLYFRMWRKENVARSTAYTTKYRQQHRQQYNARVRLYRKDRAHVWDHNRRARLLAGGIYTIQEWCALLEKYEYRCLACGSKDHIVVDHVIPLSRGGMNTIDNLQPLCFTCNAKKHAKTIDYRPDRIVVESKH